MSGSLTHSVLGQSFSLSISPPLYELMIQPGKTVTQEYTLINEGTDSFITPRLVSFEPSDNKGNIKFVGIDSGIRRNDNTPSHTGLDPVSILKSWFSITNNDLAIDKPFLLKQGQTKQITLRISLPKNALEDDYYLTFLFESNPVAISPSPKTGPTQVGIIGSNILLTISNNGTPIKKGEITKFEIRNSKFEIIDSFSKPEFQLTVKNTGRTFWKTFGKVTVTGLMKYKKEIDILPENVLGGGSRELRSTTCENRVEGLGVREESETTICSLRLNSQFLLGPYNAKASINIDGDSNEQTITESIIFIALPFKLIFGILGIIGVILLITQIKRIVKLKYKSSSN